MIDTDTDTDTDAVIVKVTHEEGNELPNITKEELVNFGKLLNEAASKASLSITEGDVVFIGTFKDEEQQHPYCLWKVTGLDGRSVITVRNIIGQVVGTKPNFVYMNVLERII